ncbi:MAG: DUF4918 family protein [Saprospiraceae bacterium]|nr:DUF4918 family protein [Saprospiraceae bacterium]
MHVARQECCFFQKINEQYRFFEEIQVLPHPRWVMQYRRKSMKEFVSLYLEYLTKAIFFS